MGEMAARSDGSGGRISRYLDDSFWHGVAANVVGSLVVAWSIFTLGVTVASAGRGTTAIHWLSALQTLLTCLMLGVGIWVFVNIMYRLIDGSRLPGTQWRLHAPALMLLVAIPAVAYLGSHDLDIVDKPLKGMLVVVAVYLIVVWPKKRRTQRRTIASMSSWRWHAEALVLAAVSAVTAGTSGIVLGVTFEQLGTGG